MTCIRGLNGIYQEFAYIYDSLMKDNDYRKWVDYMEAVFSHCGVRPQTIADLACGTGSITVLLKKRGYDVIGVDISGDMLDVAREKSRMIGLKIPYVCQDMRRLSLHRQVDAITCMCDGFNYLTKMEDLSSALDSINRNLKPGGLLFFDVSSYFKLSSILGSKVMGDPDEDISMIWINRFDRRDKLLTMDLTFFVRDGDRYTRIDETHVQRAYLEEELREALAEHGFDKIESFAPFSFEAPKKRSQRIFIAAIKVL